MGVMILLYKPIHNLVGLFGVDHLNRHLLRVVTILLLITIHELALLGEGQLPHFLEEPPVKTPIEGAIDMFETGH